MKSLKVLVPETIKVTIDWLDNYGAVSELVPGCVATSESIERRIYAKVRTDFERILSSPEY
jgi:hypothetical protein